jgi:GrpB-like predicted nucleotidyltransferase (UPF0157 family)
MSKAFHGVRIGRDNDRVDRDLSERLRAVGIDPGDVGDPGEAWRRLHDRYGLRATLLDRYALEAASRGVQIDELERNLRERLAHEVLSAHMPGFEVVGGSDRHRRDAIEVVPYDPNWARRFAAWRDRLAAALGATAVRIEHVGSTAVPGLAAKPVIDIQISVPDVDDEAAFVAPIEATGVAFRSREIGHRYFRPAGDRPREVQIHVCQSGSQWERVHLLFRDLLRANAPTRETYAALKRDLARRYRDDRLAYNEAKTNFILDAMERAERWAAESGWRTPGPR